LKRRVSPFSCLHGRGERGKEREKYSRRRNGSCSGPTPLYVQAKKKKESTPRHDKRHRKKEKGKKAKRFIRSKALDVPSPGRRNGCSPPPSHQRKEEKREVRTFMWGVSAGVRPEKRGKAPGRGRGSRLSRGALQISCRSEKSVAVRTLPRGGAVWGTSRLTSPAQEEGMAAFGLNLSGCARGEKGKGGGNGRETPVLPALPSSRSAQLERITRSCSRLAVARGKRKKKPDTPALVPLCRLRDVQKRRGDVKQPFIQGGGKERLLVGEVVDESLLPKRMRSW